MTRTALQDYFVREHRACDTAWAELETSADRGASRAAEEAWRAFEQAVKQNLAHEEDVLFPAFETASGMTAGPTAVMRHEHAQMRGVLQQMDAAAKRGDWPSVLDHGDTLLILMQQHNMKEEGVLFPMAAQFLQDKWPSLVARLS